MCVKIFDDIGYLPGSRKKYSSDTEIIVVVIEYFEGKYLDCNRSRNLHKFSSIYFKNQALISSSVMLIALILKIFVKKF